MFNVSYPGAPPNLNRPSMLGVAPGAGQPAGAGADGSAIEGTSGSPKRDKDNMFRCPICFEDLHKDDVFVTSMCGHEMCRGCARQMVLTAIRYPRLKALGSSTLLSRPLDLLVHALVSAVVFLSQWPVLCVRSPHLISMCILQQGTWKLHQSAKQHVLHGLHLVTGSIPELGPP